MKKAFFSLALQRRLRMQRGLASALQRVPPRHDIRHEACSTPQQPSLPCQVKRTLSQKHERPLMSCLAVRFY